MTLEQWHAERGYVVVSSTHRETIGTIIPGYHHVETSKDVNIPLKIISETNRAEFDEQVIAVFGRKPIGNPSGHRFYRAQAVD